MKVVSYLSSVPKNNTNKQKEELIEKFYKGVLRCGDSSMIQKDYFPIDCDAALIQGYMQILLQPFTRKSYRLPKSRNKYTIVADANLFYTPNKQIRYY